MVNQPRSRRSAWLSGLVIMGLNLMALPGDVAAADSGTRIPSRYLSDAQAWQSWASARPTGFQIADTGPIGGAPVVPSTLPPAPAEAAAIPKPADTAKPAELPPEKPAGRPADLPTTRGGAHRPHAAGDAGCDAYAARAGHGAGAACRLIRDASCQEGWLDNTSVFIAGDGWKNIFDRDHTSNFGFRAGFNMGLDLPGDHGVCGQLGASYGGYDFHGREALFSRDDPVEQQVFVTGGIFKRSDVAEDDPLAWGAVYDLLVAEDAGERADDLRLGQLRSYLGFALTECDEIGVWSAFRLMRDDAPQQQMTVNVTDQANLFWHRTWGHGGDTWLYVGWADDPSSTVLGLRGEAPLSSRVALSGNFHYMLPSTHGGDVHPTLLVDDCFSQEAWNVSFGLVVYTRGKAIARNVSGFLGLPLLPVADNGSFSYQAGMRP